MYIIPMQTSEKLLKHIYRKRPLWSKKGDFGRLLIIGGSDIYSGSPALNALAAYRSGCDLVEICTPESVVNVVRSFSPNLIVHPLKGHFLTESNLEHIENLAKRSDAIVIGGGLGRRQETLEAVQQILDKIPLPTVLDADGIYSITGKLRQNIIVTPHSGEFFKMTKIKLTTDVKERIEETRKASQNHDCVILAKGHVDVISDGRSVYVNKTGTPYMTKAGTGDVLAGICGSLLARGVKPIIAASAAAYINGLAGNKALKEFGEGLTATDLINNIQKVI